MMVESFKYKSKIATAIGAIATIVTIVGQDYLMTLFPSFGQYIPLIVALASWYLAQSTENKRVEVAEQLVHEEYDTQPIVSDCFDNDAPLNSEYECDDYEC